LLFGLLQILPQEITAAAMDIAATASDNTIWSMKNATGKK
jgi:hypothetical protein